MRWIDQPVQRTWFQSRFAVAGDELVRVLGDAVVVFDPKDNAAWNLLLADEQLDLKGGRGPAMFQVVNDLASASALLIAELARSTEKDRVRVAGPIRVVTHPDGKREGDAWAELRRKKGGTTGYGVLLTFAGGEVTELRVRHRDGGAPAPAARAGGPMVLPGRRR